MDFSLTETQAAIEESAGRLCARFGDDYWADLDARGEFPSAFRDAMVEGGWLGIAMPKACGGSGLGISEAAILMHGVARSPGAMAAASSIHMNIFGAHPIVVHGSEAQKHRWLPELIAGRDIACFGVTEPDAGLDTTRIRTRAERDGDAYVVNGRKIWTSGAQVANRIMLLARTRPPGQGERPAAGLSLFYTALDRTHVEVREIAKLGRHAVDSNSSSSTTCGCRERPHRRGRQGLLLPARRAQSGAHPGRGGSGRDRTPSARPCGTLRRASGSSSAGPSPQPGHPAPARPQLRRAGGGLAHLLRAAWAYDRGLPCGTEANAAKYLAAEAAFTACERAVLTHGGMGYAREFHVERLLREVLIPRIAPVSQELILCYLAEKGLGLPKSY